MYKYFAMMLEVADKNPLGSFLLKEAHYNISII
jgi:hypothetical protein